MIFFLVFLATVVVLQALRRRAGWFGLVSHPGAHRLHNRPTPLVGGLGVFVGITVGICLLPFESELRYAVLAAGAVLVAVGVWDDIKEASFVPRFLAQAMAVCLLAYIADVSLRELGYIFNTSHPMALGRWGIALTIFAAVGVINAVNMSDGLDGLAGGLSLVTCGALAVAAHISGYTVYLPFLGVVAAALAGFMLFNVRIPGLGAARLYLGDAGSLLIGFVLAWFLIAMTQGESRALAPVTALWIFALPLFDTVAALLRRPIQGRSPFHADRTHYHHYLRDLGLSVNQTLIVSLAAAVVLASVGMYGELNGVAEHVMFYTFLGLFAVYFALMVYLDANITRLVNLRKRAGESRAQVDSADAAETARAR